MRQFLAVFLLPALIFLSACDAVERQAADLDGAAEAAGGDAAVVGAVQELEWRTDAAEALRVAGEKEQILLMNFTGSDWCPPCIQLKKDVFSTEKFQDYAKENIVLLELDFPRGEKQSDELRRQNQALQQRFRIEGYPTLIVVGPDGKEIKRHVGYMPGGPEAFIAWTK